MSKQQKSKTRTLFTERYIYSSIPFIVSTVSVLAISWKSLETLNILNTPWALPIIALFSGIYTFFLPVLVRRYKWLFTIFETGFTLLIIQLLEAIMPDINKLLMACCTGILAFIIGDIVNMFISYNFNILNTIQNLVVAFGLTLCSFYLADSIFVIPIIMCSFALMMYSCKIRLPIDDKLDSYSAKIIDTLYEPEEKKENK